MKYLGTIPKQLGSLSMLAYIFLSNANITGLMHNHNDCACLIPQTGQIPSELCSNTALNSIDVTGTSISCIPSCLYKNSILMVDPSVQQCPGPQDVALCALTAATSISSLWMDWQCSTVGMPLTQPCDAPWTGLECNQGLVVGIDIPSFGITGKALYDVVLSTFTTLQEVCLRSSFCCRILRILFWTRTASLVIFLHRIFSCC